MVPRYKANYMTVLKLKHCLQTEYSQVQNKWEDVYFFMIFGDPMQLILTPLFINFSNVTREYKEVHKIYDRL